MNSNPNAPEVDVLSLIDAAISGAESPVRERRGHREGLIHARRFVAALLTREAALVAESEALKDERDQLNSDYLTAINAANVIAAENKALRAIPEEVAAGWDGCYYEANPVYGDDNKPMSIGDRIRSSAGRLLRAAIALTPAKESNDGYDFLHELRQACVLAGLYRATVQGDEYKPVELSYIDAIEEKAIAKVAELHAADKDFDSANAAVGQAMLGSEEARALAMSAWIKAYKRRAEAIRAFEGRV